MFNEGMGYYLQSIRSEKFIFLIYAFTVAEYSFFCYFIFIILAKHNIRRIVPFVWIGFVLLAIIDIVYIAKDNGFDSFASGIECIIVLLLCISYLFSEIRGSNSLKLYSTFNFWVVVAFLIYFSGTFFLYLLTNKMHTNTSFHKLYFVINISFNILKNVLLCVAMTMKLTSTASQQKNVIPDLDDELFIQSKTNYQD